jgi:acetyl-CoA acetyltransferase family protein
MNNERIAVVKGLRSPFLKMGSDFKHYDADDLAAFVLRQLMLVSKVSIQDVDHVIIGNVSQPSKAANVARVSALKAGFPNHIPAYSVQRNCASGMEAISTAMNALWADQADVIVAGGTESMSNIPFLFSKPMKQFFEKLFRAKTLFEKIQLFLSFKLKYLKPTIGLIDGLTDPVCGQLMGVTAENLAREFSITREEQDIYALKSHQKACEAQQAGFFEHEIVPLILSKNNISISRDNGPRVDQKIESLNKLKPYFDRRYGTVTVGNSCPITDGAAMVVLMKESEAKRRGLDVLGYIRSYNYAGLEPSRMGLGPIYATAKLFKRTGLSLHDIDAIEMNEAFAAQILANVRAFSSSEFSRRCLNQSDALGDINMETLNMHGGAIALGHPVGATGVRLIITLLHTLKKIQKTRGLATLCVGGGQGGSFIVEVDS